MFRFLFLLSGILVQLQQEEVVDDPGRCFDEGAVPMGINCAVPAQPLHVGEVMFQFRQRHSDSSLDSFPFGFVEHVKFLFC